MRQDNHLPFAFPVTFVLTLGLSVAMAACMPDIPNRPRGATPDAGQPPPPTTPPPDAGPGGSLPDAATLAVDARSDATPDAAAGGTSDLAAADLAAVETAGADALLGTDGCGDTTPPPPPPPPPPPEDPCGGPTPSDAGASVDTGAPPPTSGARAPQAGELEIVEVLVNPGGTDTSREWIEVVNRASATLDLGGLYVGDAASFAATPAGTLAPGALVVLGQSTDPAKNGGADVAFSYGSKITWNNDGDTARLCLGPCDTGLEIGRVAWGALGTAYDGHAVMYEGMGASHCAAPAPFGDGTSYGTPGAVNPACE